MYISRSTIPRIRSSSPHVTPLIFLLPLLASSKCCQSKVILFLYSFNWVGGLILAPPTEIYYTPQPQLLLVPVSASRSCVCAAERGVNDARRRKNAIISSCGRCGWLSMTSLANVCALVWQMLKNEARCFKRDS